MPYITDTAYAVGNGDEALKESSTSERKNVPEGVWNVQVIDALPNDYYDKTDKVGGVKEGDPLPNAIIKKLIPLEVIDEGEFATQRTLISVYLPPTDEGNDTHKAKYNMGKQRISMLAKACGLDSVSDLNDCAGKFVRITLKEKDGFMNMIKAEPYSALHSMIKEEVKVEAKPETETAIADDIPF